ncbi:hypothetical protein AB0O76_01670 [Streptomyces sp. NPDC086554]|uniref:hypothetical protein n=1 Tax=Streptomyces sp. NPDC086554 TaxID=3154864 RepID=UPI00342CBF58
MHHHGYAWLGERKQFDQEALRRPPHPDPPPVEGNAELLNRYREVQAEFPVVDLPPMGTAFWLIKPSKLVRGTWGRPKQAAEWLGERLAEHAPRFASPQDRDTTKLAVLVASAVERLSWGGDVSLGYYVGQTQFLSLAIVACPNRAERELPCPAPGNPEDPETPQAPLS